MLRQVAGDALHERLRRDGLVPGAEQDEQFVGLRVFVQVPPGFLFQGQDFQAVQCLFQENLGGFGLAGLGGDEGERVREVQRDVLDALHDVRKTGF